MYFFVVFRLGIMVFRKHFAFCFDKRYEIGVIFNQYNRDFLTGISLLIRMIENIDFVSELDIEDDFFKRNSPFSLAHFILF